MLEFVKLFMYFISLKCLHYSLTKQGIIILQMNRLRFGDIVFPKSQATEK